MCSRFCITSPPQAIRDTFGYREQPNFPPRYNIAPTDPIPVVRTDLADRSARSFALVRWGLIPSWAKDLKALPLTINARSETVGEKPAFRSAYRYRRCLVPCDGFYEWTGPKGNKQPFLFRPEAAAPEAPFALAGIWEHWMDPDGNEMETAAILTCAANASMAPYHDRMPVVLAAETFETWLDCAEGHLDTANAIIAEACAVAFTARPVSKALSNPRNEGPQLHEGPIGPLI